MIWLLENNIRGGTSSVMIDRYVKAEDNKKILYIVANKLYGHPMLQPLPYDAIKLEKENVCIREIISTPDDNDIGCFSEVHLSYPFIIRQKTK